MTDAPWINWGVAGPFLVGILVFAAFVMWARGDNRCEHTEWRTIRVTPTKGSRGIERYQVCVDGKEGQK